MFVSVLAVALLSIVSAHPGYLTYGHPGLLTYAAGHVSSQHHAQDDLGQYSYGYNTDSSSKTEQRTLDGVTRGAYSYVDAEGKLQSVHYTADPLHGFRVAATNLPEHSAAAPVPVQDTPEVAQAKSEHFAAVEEAKVRNAAAPVEIEVPTVKYVAQIAPVTSFTYNHVAPVVVPHHQAYAYSAYHPYHYAPLAYSYAGNYLQDTPEVAQAKADHFAAHAEAKARHFSAKYLY